MNELHRSKVESVRMIQNMIFLCSKQYKRKIKYAIHKLHNRNIIISIRSVVDLIKLFTSVSMFVNIEIRLK